MDGMVDHETRAGLARLLLRRPELGNEFIRFASTPTGADLCQSYELAWQAVMYWAEVPGRETSEVAADFRRLITAFEQEASQVVANSDAHRRRVSG